MEHDEFDVYFEKAAALQALHDSITQTEEATRRGSLPDDVSTRLHPNDADDKHRRTFSCKITRPVTEGRGGGSPASAGKLGGHSPARRRSPIRKNSDDLRRGSAVCTMGLLSPDTGLHSDGGDNNSTSSPPSRKGSFKRMTRPRSMRDFQEAYGDSLTGNGSSNSRRESVNLEETVAAKLNELQLLNNEDCCVVRSFVTSSTGLINRGDSVRRKSSSSSMKDTKEVHEPASGATAGVNTGARASVMEGSLARIESRDTASHVRILGDRRVGKTALLTQFMTSEYLAALDSCFGMKHWIIIFLILFLGDCSTVKFAKYDLIVIYSEL